MDLKSDPTRSVRIGLVYRFFRFLCAPLVSGSSRQSQAMSLRLFEPSLDDGKIVVTPPISVLERGAKRWECCLVGFILDNRLPSLVVKSIALKMWARKGLIDVLAQGSGSFFFQFFHAEEGLNEVLQGGPWLIAGRHVFLHKWQQGVKLYKEKVDKIPVWI